MMPVALSVPVLAVFSVAVPVLIPFSLLAGEVLMQLPQLDL
jgi:hypothetical protein